MTKTEKEFPEKAFHLVVLLLYLHIKDPPIPRVLGELSFDVKVPNHCQILNLTYSFRFN